MTTVITITSFEIEKSIITIITGCIPQIPLLWFKKLSVANVVQLCVSKWQYLKKAQSFLIRKSSRASSNTQNNHKNLSAIGSSNKTDTFYGSGQSLAIVPTQQPLKHLRRDPIVKQGYQHRSALPCKSHNGKLKLWYNIICHESWYFSLHEYNQSFTRHLPSILIK